ncbi:hypothetical protein X975_05828, partial [Stegodyphus mimosarum]
PASRVVAKDKRSTAINVKSDVISSLLNTISKDDELTAKKERPSSFKVKSSQAGYVVLSSANHYKKVLPTSKGNGRRCSLQQLLTPSK